MNATCLGRKKRCLIRTFFWRESSGNFVLRIENNDSTIELWLGVWLWLITVNLIVVFLASGGVIEEDLLQSIYDKSIQRAKRLVA
jgi:hypothetical protein